MQKSEVKFNSIESAIEDIAAGKFVVVADDSDRENEGDLIFAAEKVTPEHINFMAKFGRGLICLALNKEKVENLELDSMVSVNTDALSTAFTISIDADPKFGVSTGISASDRAKTIEVALDENTQPRDLRRPGHIFPLKAVDGGVLKRVGHTEAAVDLARLAGLKPAGVICEILKENGEMARRDDLMQYCQEHNLKFITIADLVAYRLQRERFVHRMAEANYPNQHNEDFKIYTYKDFLSQREHIALVLGDIQKASKEGETIPVRMHREYLSADLFPSLRHDNDDYISRSIDIIRERGCGVIVYLRQMMKEVSLVTQVEKLNGINHDDNNSPDLRTYGVGAQILTDLGLHRISLISNNPVKIHGLEGYGIQVEDNISL